MHRLFAHVFWITGVVLLWPFPLHAQAPTPSGSASGRIALTVLDAQGEPVAGVEAHFLTEQQVQLATCLTNIRGQCLLDLPEAPTDANGFIRGSLQLAERGRRPLIWPGGDFDLTVELDEAGVLDLPVDVFVTRTPNSHTSMPISTTAVVVTPPLAAIVVRTAVLAASEREAAGEGNEAMSAATPVAAPTPARPADAPTTVNRDFPIIVVLLSLFLLTILLYGWAHAKGLLRD